jgi:hypothetical protein
LMFIHRHTLMDGLLKNIKLQVGVGEKKNNLVKPN